MSHDMRGLLSDAVCPDTTKLRHTRVCPPPQPGSFLGRISMHQLLFVTVSLAAIAACKEVDPDFCKNLVHANDPICATGGPCTTNDNCMSTPILPVCDLTENEGTCVRCTAGDHALC